MLEQADLPLRAAELLFYAPAFAIIVFLLFAVLVGPHRRPRRGRRRRDRLRSRTSNNRQRGRQQARSSASCPTR